MQGAQVDQDVDQRVVVDRVGDELILARNLGAADAAGQERAVLPAGGRGAAAGGNAV